MFTVWFMHLQDYLVVCFGKHPEYYTVYFESEQENCSTFISKDLKATQQGLFPSLDVNANLAAGCVYTIIIEAKNEAGQANSTGRKRIGTVRVQFSWLKVL